MNIWVALAATLAAVGHSSGLSSGKPVPFEINLDDPPEQRWVSVAAAYKDILPAMFLAFDKLLADSLLKPDGKNKFLRSSNIPAEYIAELSGIVKTVGHENVTLDRLILFQMMYELVLYPGASKPEAPTSAGIVAVDTNGTVFHGRNFDAELFFVGRGRAMNLEDVTLDLTWKRNGSAVFTSVNLLGQIGVHTGMTSGGSPWSAHQSVWLGQEASTLAQEIRSGNLVSAEAGGKIHTIVLRGLMESQIDFKEAVLRLERTRLCAPQYLVLAGSRPWDGAILTCDRSSHAEGMNNVQVLSQEIGRWFLLQADDDIWGDIEDKRRPDAAELVSNLGQPGITSGGMVTAMRTYPTFAFNTVFTWIAAPATGESHIFMASEMVDGFAGAPLSMNSGSTSLRRLRG